MLYSDRSEIYLSDENVRIETFNLVESYDEKSHSFQTIEDIDTKF